MGTKKLSMKDKIALGIVLAITIFLWAVPTEFFGIEGLTPVMQRTIAIFVFTALINAVPFAQWNILVVMISGGLICWILSNFISNSAAANLIVPILAVVGTALLDDPTSCTSFLALSGEPCDKARRFLKTSGYDI